MIAGGTGDFGNTVLKHFLESDIGMTHAFSRDEKKRNNMRYGLQERSTELAGKVRIILEMSSIFRVCAMPCVEWTTCSMLQL